MKIVITSKARQELLQIHSYIAQRNLAAAEALMQDVDRKFENLSRFPFIGRERSNLFPELRSMVVGSYLIFYVVERERIVIYRVLHGRRDIDAEFQR